jgi:DNA-binding GntR family transcriptional regulator
MVLAALREAIVSGRLPPGERVVIDEVARRFGVSIIPVREAMRQLEAEHLVTSQPHVGPVVTGFTQDAAAELFSLLECLELAAARHAVERVSDDDLADLTRSAEAVERAAATRWEEANARFHARFAACAHMPRIAEHLAGVSSEWERLYRLRYKDAASPDRTRAEGEHRALIAALRKRELPALEAVIREHNRRAAGHYTG